MFVKKYYWSAIEESLVLLISTELEEVLSLSDRIFVMYAGKIVDEVDAQHAKVEQIGIMMAGGSKKDQLVVIDTQGQV